MEIRKGREEDLPELMKLYEGARSFMREHGNKEQWSGGYPQEELLRQNIESGDFYICEENGEVAAAFYFHVGEDPTYRQIEGSWLNDRPYGVIHRITSRRHGAATFCVQWCVQQMPELRIDTHKDNYVMQNFIKKNGFTYCGIIHLEDGSSRLAYQRQENVT